MEGEGGGCGVEVGVAVVVCVRLVEVEVELVVGWRFRDGWDDRAGGGSPGGVRVGGGGGVGEYEMSA